MAAQMEQNLGQIATCTAPQARVLAWNKQIYASLSGRALALSWIGPTSSTSRLACCTPSSALLLSISPLPSPCRPRCSHVNHLDPPDSSLRPSRPSPSSSLLNPSATPFFIIGSRALSFPFSISRALTADAAPPRTRSLCWRPNPSPARDVACRAHFCSSTKLRLVQSHSQWRANNPCLLEI